ncbi:MAG: hypothetical protein H7Z76_07305 [Methylotenera sp.]|nr:hypothetical protein [Flavobacterium sp.]
MINALIAYDENDVDFGVYFLESHDDIISDCKQNQLVSSISICGFNCTEEGIKKSLNIINGNSFVFIAISHGNEDEFWSHEVYLSANNASQFQNSFIYSTSCSTGKNLAQILIDNGSLAFIGYNDTILVPLDYSKLFYTCENYGIKSFLNNEETIETSYNKLIENYTIEIDILTAGSMEELIIASTLIDNRDRLILLGNGSLTRNYFN